MDVILQIFPNDLAHAYYRMNTVVNLPLSDQNNTRNPSLHPARLPRCAVL